MAHPMWLQYIQGQSPYAVPGAAMKPASIRYRKRIRDSELCCFLIRNCSRVKRWCALCIVVIQELCNSAAADRFGMELKEWL